MTTLEMILLGLLVADALALVGLILIQQGKGADVGAAFGSGSANAVFGGQGSASALTKMTAFLSIGFFVIAFGLAYTAKERAVNIDDLGLPELPAGLVTEPADNVIPAPDLESAPAEDEIEVPDV